MKIYPQNGSENARAVAVEVAERVGKGLKINMGEIIRKKGYSESVSKTPARVTCTLSYKNAINELISNMQNEVLQIVKSMSLKRDRATFRDLVEGMEKTTRGIVLLSQNNNLGLSTEDSISKEEKDRILEALNQNRQEPPA